MTRLQIRGFDIHKGYLDTARQSALLDTLRPVLEAAPLFSPETPRGGKMSVRMTSAGRFGWFSDRRGYRYADRHPDGVDWPAIPDDVLRIWHPMSDDRAF